MDNEQKETNLNSQSLNSFEEISKNIEVNPKNSRKRFLKFALAFVLIIAVVFGIIFSYENYFSPEAKFQKEQKQNYEKYLAWKEKYEKAMTEDTYGGKTPEETLQMFIDALKKGDVELASKYFVLREDGKPDAKWLNLLIKIKNDGNLQKMSEDLQKYNLAKKTFDSYYVFVYYNKDGGVGLQLTMKFNNLAKIWKIESL